MADETPWGLPPAPSPPPGPPLPPLPSNLPPPPGPSAPSGEGVPVTKAAEDRFDDTRPEPGSLHLKGGRSWRTWQLVLAVIVAAVIGMWFNGNTGSASSASQSPRAVGLGHVPTSRTERSGGNPDHHRRRFTQLDVDHHRRRIGRYNHHNGSRRIG